MPTKRRLRVLITDSNELAGLGAVRSLGRAGYALTLGVSERVPANPARWSRFAGRTVVYPDPWKRQREFQDWLGSAARSGEWDAILPNSEAAIVAAVKIRAEGSGAVIIAPGDDVLPYTLSKFAATEAARRAGIPIPETSFVEAAASEAEVHSILRESRFPLILKTDNSAGRNGEYRKGHTYVLRSLEEALYLLPEIREEGNRFLLQEQIEGFGAGAFLLLREGAVLLRFAHRRLHEVPFTGGYSSFRVSTKDEEAIALSERLLRAIGYDGAAMVEFRRNPRTGKTYFLEINGRLWGSIALALHAGVDFPRALADTALGRKMSERAPEYPVGLRCRHTPGEIAHVLSILKAGAAEGVGRERKLAAIGEFVRLSLDPRIRHDHFWWSDPLPGVYQAFDSLGFLVRRAAEAVSDRRAARKGKRALAAAIEQQRTRSRDLQVSSVVFLCYGNICRSPFAEQYWNTVLRRAQEDLPKAISAGFHANTGRRTPAKIAAFVRQEFGVDLEEHRSQRVDRAMLREAGAVLVMDRENFEALERDFPDVARDKAFLLGIFGDGKETEIEDPFLLTDPQRVRACYQQLRAALDGLAGRLSEAGTELREFPNVTAGQ